MDRDTIISAGDESSNTKVARKCAKARLGSAALLGFNFSGGVSSG
jgi:hypothetical protein